MKCWNSAIKSTFIACIIIATIVQTCFVSATYAQGFQFESGFKRDRIPFKLVKNLIIIPVYIDNKGPYNFILDTGVDPLIITDSTIVSKADLTNLRNVKINGIGEGDEITAYISNRISTKIGDATMLNVPTVILKEDVFNLSSHLGMKIHGLIGYPFFNSFIVKINYTNTHVFFSLPQARKKIKWTRLDLEFLDNKPYINTEIELPDLGKIAAKLIIDCGASHALSLESYHGAIFPLPVPSFQANLGIGLSGKISGSIGRISSIKLGSYTFNEVITSFPNFSDVAAKAKQKERTGNLGSEILKRFTIVFDYQDGAMYLRKNGLYRQAFEHDMSGMEVYVDGQSFNRTFVSRVEPDSPAEKAGILANDEILSINFIRIKDYTLESITSLFKSQNGKTLLIEVARGEKISIKLITLKRRL
ncbi:MAG: aspartyl protease family protein [Bacteroidota bacterium]